MIAVGAALCMCAAMTGCGGSFKGMSMSEVFSQSGAHVWYNCKNAAKDSEIMSYYVIEDGTVTYYYYSHDMFGQPSRLTLGDVAGMTDADVISYVKEKTSASVLNDLTFTVVTDDSGNEVVSEIIHSDTGYDISSFWHMVEIFYSKDEYLPVESFQIFDAYFDGYTHWSYWYSHACLVTKTDNKFDYVLNKIGDDGVKVK